LSPFFKRKRSRKELLHFLSLLEKALAEKYISFLFPKLFFSKKKKGSVSLVGW